MERTTTSRRPGRRLDRALVAGALLLATTGCSQVQPWQKETLALAPMAVENDVCHRFEHNIEAYREGAVGGAGGKSGGGCGCS